MKFCFYCDAPLEAGNIEKDHFPLPERHGGTQTVDACITCHGMKDRFKAENWHLDAISTIFSWLMSQKPPREVRIALAKCAALICDMMASNNPLYEAIEEAEANPRPLPRMKRLLKEPGYFDKVSP